MKAVLPVQEQLPLTLRFAGQEILAVAAETPQQAEEALKLITVEYDKRPFVVDMDQARQESAPLVFEKKVAAETSAGDIPEKEEEVKQVGNVRGPMVTTHGGTVENQLTVWVSTQGTFTVRDELAAVLGLPKSNIRVIRHYVGGVALNLAPGLWRYDSEVGPPGPGVRPVIRKWN